MTRCPDGGLALVDHLMRQTLKRTSAPPKRFVCSKAIAETIARDLEASCFPQQDHVELKNGDTLMGMTVGVILEGYGHGLAWVST